MANNNIGTLPLPTIAQPKPYTPTSTIFLQNLPFQKDFDKEIFKLLIQDQLLKYGVVEKLELKNEGDDTGKVYAEVKFDSVESAKKAVKGLDQSDILCKGLLTDNSQRRQNLRRREKNRRHAPKPAATRSLPDKPAGQDHQHQ